MPTDTQRAELLRVAKRTIELSGAMWEDARLLARHVQATLTVPAVEQAVAADDIDCMCGHPKAQHNTKGLNEGQCQHYGYGCMCGGYVAQPMTVLARERDALKHELAAIRSRGPDVDVDAVIEAVRKVRPVSTSSPDPGTLIHFMAGFDCALDRVKNEISRRLDAAKKGGG